jgi:hypothetical protein
MQPLGRNFYPLGMMISYMLSKFHPRNVIAPLRSKCCTIIILLPFLKYAHEPSIGEMISFQYPTDAPPGINRGGFRSDLSFEIYKIKFLEENTL